MATSNTSSVEEDVRHFVKTKLESATDKEEQTRLMALQSQLDAYTFLSGVLPEHTRKVINFDEEHATLNFEEFCDANSLWSEILESTVNEMAIQQLAKVLAKLHYSSRSMSGSPNPERDFPSGNPQAILKLKSSMFTNLHQSNDDATNQRLSILQDPGMREKVQKLEDLFINKKDGIIHGSLDPTCISVEAGRPTLMNCGLCRPGPFGFDLGTLLASYMTLYHVHMLNPVDNDAHRRIAYKMMDACNNTVSTYVQEMKEALSEKEIESIISDAAGFAACELIRRSHTQSLYPGISQELTSVRTEMAESGLRLLRQYESIHDAGRLLMIGLMLC